MKRVGIYGGRHTTFAPWESHRYVLRQDLLQWSYNTGSMGRDCRSIHSTEVLQTCVLPRVRV